MWGFGKSRHLKIVYHMPKLWKCGVFQNAYVLYIILGRKYLLPHKLLQIFCQRFSLFALHNFCTLNNILCHLKYLCHKYVNVINTDIIIRQWFPGKFLASLKKNSNKIFHSVTLNSCLMKVWHHYKSAFLISYTVADA